MSTRFVFATQPSMYHQNGLEVAKKDMPSMVNIKRFLSIVLERTMVDYNPADKHKCTALCGQPIQLLYGFPHCGEVKEPVTKTEILNDVTTICGFADDTLIMIRIPRGTKTYSNHVWFLTTRLTSLTNRKVDHRTRIHFRLI